MAAGDDIFQQYRNAGAGSAVPAPAATSTAPPPASTTAAPTAGGDIFQQYRANPPSTTAPASTAAAAPSDDKDKAEAYGMMAPAFAPGTTGRDVANAFVGGIYGVGADVARNLGITPNPLPADVQSTMAAHPLVTGVGSLLGGAAVAAPLTLGAEVAAPAIGIGTGLGGSIATGAGIGAVQNALAGDPDQSIFQRAGEGALVGGVLGGVANKVVPFVANKVGGWLAPEAAATAGREAEASGAGTAAAGPQPAGAAVTPPGLATLTPEETAAYRATAEGNKLLENQRVGEPDRTAYIPDVTPNLAEQEQTVNAARELKTLGITSQDASQDMKLAAQANNDARTSYWNDTTRSPVDIQRAEAARDLQAQADLKATWANKTDADASPVQNVANQILAGPDGKRKAVQSAVNSVLSELTDQNGNLETDPEILYGVRKHIGDMLSKEGQRETPLAARATDNLITLRDTLDGVIEQAAPGFKQYLQNFAAASKPIDEMQVLQDATPNLFKGPNATLRYGDFQRFMKNVVDMRQGPGVNPYKSISDDTMQRLWNLRDDLRRSAGALELARAPGSDTAPNIIDAIKQYGKLGGSMVVDAAASHLFGPAGPIMVRGTRAMLAPITAARTARAQQARVREMLYPSNPLTPPPGGNPLTPP